MSLVVRKGRLSAQRRRLKTSGSGRNQARSNFYLPANWQRARKAIVTGMFIGTHINKVDSKNRVSVPPDFRTLLSRDEDYSLICFPSFTHNCLEGGGVSYIRKLQDMMEDLDPYDPIREAFEHSVISEAIRLPVDGDGRVTLNESFFRHARIEDKLAFVGRGDHLQIWNPDQLECRAEGWRALAKKNPHHLRARRRSPGGWEHAPDAERERMARRIIRPYEDDEGETGGGAEW